MDAENYQSAASLIKTLKRHLIAIKKVQQTFKVIKHTLNNQNKSIKSTKNKIKETL